MKNLWRGFLILLLAAAVPTDARAALDASYSETEKVAFAFAKLGHFKPDFAAMIKASPAYEKADPVDKVELLRLGIPRLQAGYDQYDPAQDLIDIMADIKLARVEDPTAAKTAAPQKMKIVFPDKIISFPFSIGAICVDLVPVDFQGAMTLSLSDEEYATFTHALGSDGMTQAVIEMHVQPLRVDADHPGMEKGQPAWPMLTAVKQITVWDKSRQHMIWSYAAPDYHAADTHHLNDLYIK